MSLPLDNLVIDGGPRSILISLLQHALRAAAFEDCLETWLSIEFGFAHVVAKDCQFDSARLLPDGYTNDLSISSVSFDLYSHLWPLKDLRTVFHI